MAAIRRYYRHNLPTADAVREIAMSECRYNPTMAEVRELLAKLIQERKTNK